MTGDDIELARMQLLEFTGNAKDLDEVLSQSLAAHKLAGDLLTEVVRLRTLLVRVQTKAVVIQTVTSELFDLGREGNQ